MIAAAASFAWRGTPHASAETQTGSAPTFYRDVLPILQQHCQSCHRPGEIAPLPLVTYEQARTRSVDRLPSSPGTGKCRRGSPIRTSDISRTILRLRPQEIATLAAWADCGRARRQSAAMRRRRAVGRRAGTFPSPTSSCKCRSPWRCPRTAMLNTPTKSCPPDFNEGRNGCRCPKFGREPRERASRGRLHSSAGFEVAAARARRRALHRLGSDRRTRSRRDAHWTDADILLVYAPGSSPDNWPEGMAKFDSCRFGSCVSDALHRARTRGERPDRASESCSQRSRRRSAC